MSELASAARTERGEGPGGSGLRAEADLVARVLEVRVVAGQRVAEGEELVLLESMKMEIPVLAGRAGSVAEVAVAVGAAVQPGDLLVLLSAD
ncbi:biotin/lipoyl-binding carrier protein [Pseudonocardia alaniniphila]|uniref:Biotin/lipoyl-binding carrier protein n=1 Tax=Pseudonocardia alaniniphila TaxID=75291 RepID=A0ABS9T989_9PSEU|nr:biotin/lipoyl-binding carrier protein [Pseudonocardia alaniniphila]MCH6165105.1 biotin/lipoyl-binding carrier protein [Pseudonocardia alaniniphila]